MFSLFKKKPRPSAASIIEKGIDSIDRKEPEVSDMLYGTIFGPALSIYRVIEKNGDLPKGYRSDGFIFEFAAYLIFRADVYLFTHYPSHRQDVVNFLHEETASIFSQPFDLSREEIYSLLGDRMEFYAPLVRAGASLESVDTTVMITVHDTAKNNGIPMAGIESRGIRPASAIDEFSIKILMPSWEVTNITGLHKLLDALYK